MSRPHSIEGLKTKQAEVPWRRGKTVSRLSTDTSCSTKLPLVSACLPTQQILNLAVSWKTDTFKLWCWKRLLRIPWTARRSNESILKEINPVYSLEGLMKLKHWLIGKDLDAGKDWGQEKKGMTKNEMIGLIELSTSTRLYWVEVGPKSND